jgi:tetratricopeptide (TPR) repeat protein
MWPLAAHSQGMEFGEEEVGVVEEASPVAKFIEEGQNLYKQRQFAEASLLFSRVLQEQDSSAEVYHAQAEYELGKALLRLELPQGALSHFSKIVETGADHEYFLPTLRGLILLTDSIQEEPSLMEMLAQYSEYYPDDVPEKYRDRFAYLVGRHLFDNVEYDAAIDMLMDVSRRSPEFAKSRYLAGVAHVANYDAKPAVKAYKAVLRMMASKQDSDGLTADEAALLDMTNLAMARVFYSTGQYDTSLKYYEVIGRDSSFWPVALFEASWVHFQADLHGRALGNLHTISSPFFGSFFFPEAQILSSVIFFYNCKYKRVRHVLEDFIYTYEPLKLEVEEQVDNNDPDAVFSWLLAARERGESEKELGRVLAAAFSDKELQRKIALIESIGAEEEKMKSMGSKWRSSELGRSMQEEYDLAKSFVQNEAGELTQQRLGRVHRELTDLILKQKMILFEVARAEKGDLESDLRAEMNVERQMRAFDPLSLSDEDLYWTFEGEYWRDELGYYLFDTNSECKR